MDQVSSSILWCLLCSLCAAALRGLYLTRRYLCLSALTRDVKRNQENQILVFRNEIRFCIFSKRNSNLFFSSSSRKLHKNYQMSGTVNSHTCLTLGVYIKRSNMGGKEIIYYNFYEGQ